MGGRIFAGIGQLLLALAGFLMVTGWFIQFYLDLYRQWNGAAAEPLPFPWLGPAGVVAFLIAWFWSLITSISLLREGQHNEATNLT